MNNPLGDLRQAVQQAAERLAELQRDRERLEGELADTRREVDELKQRLGEIHEQLGRESARVVRLRGYAAERHEVRDRLVKLLERLESMRG